ncbi:MAG: hypothetical protein ACK58N_03855 [Synechocystis sp.]|jgi:hypothetical protein
MSNLTVQDIIRSLDSFSDEDKDKLFDALIRQRKRKLTTTSSQEKKAHSLKIFKNSPSNTTKNKLVNKINSLQGKYAHVRTSSEDFANRKAIEISLENRE